MKGLGISTGAVSPLSPSGAAPTPTRYYEILRHGFDENSDVSISTDQGSVDLTVNETFEGRDQLLKMYFNTSFDNLTQFLFNDAVGPTATADVDIALTYYLHDPDNQITSDKFDVAVTVDGVHFKQDPGDSYLIPTMQTNQWVTITGQASVTSKDLSVIKMSIPILPFFSSDYNWTLYIDDMVVRYLA